MATLIEISRIFVTTFFLSLVMPIFWIVIFLVFLQYKKIAATEQKLFGRRINGVGRQMLLSAGLGLAGGFVASFVLVLLGLSLEQIGLYFIWPVALLLLLINPRYLCFSYAGGIVGVAVLTARHILVPLQPALADSFILQSLLKVHIPALLVLIGLLHLVEAFLIFSGGHWGCSPIYLKNRDNRVVGAFSLQRFWPLPLVALLVSVVIQTDLVGVTMPDWWPILKSTLQPADGQSLQYMVIPVAAGLGYADLAVSSTPRGRARFSASSLAVYSLALLGIAVGAEYLPVLTLPGVLIAPLGHEFLILYGKRKEENHDPRYSQDQAGVRLMKVLPDTAAAEAGLRDDDLVTGVNGVKPLDGQDLLQKIEESYFMVLLEVFRGGSSLSLVLKKKNSSIPEFGQYLRAGLPGRSGRNLIHRGAELGMIPVPAPDSPVYLEIRKSDPMGILKSFGRKVKSLLPARQVK